MELRKQASWSQTDASLFHYRTVSGREVDVVLEAPSGDLVGIEIKASATVKTGDFKGLRALAEATGKRFRRGILLYQGNETISFGPNLHAMPIDALWRI